MQYVVAAINKWNHEIFHKETKKFIGNWFLVSNPEELTLDYLRSIKPRYIFFPHWSYIIPAVIYEEFECIIFHMTDVPFGRGGSPLQNLIARGIYETKLTALRCVEKLDAGPVYIKQALSLHGNAEEIYIRAGMLTWKMIRWIIKNEPAPVEQYGTPVYFPRRKPADGNLNNVKSLQGVYDFIRMLDAEGYPLSFLESGRFRMEFSRASLKQGCVVAEVKITIKEEHNDSKQSSSSSRPS